MQKPLSIIAIICFVLIPVHSRSQSPVTLAVNVMGAEGKPLKNAYVKIISKDFKQEIIHDDGRFIIHLPETGVYEFWAGGVHHKSLTFPLLIEETAKVELKIKLATAKYEENMDTVFVVGDFNDFSIKSGSIKMNRIKDGKFTATVPVEGDSLAYQLLGIQYGWHPIEGTQAHHYAYQVSKQENLLGSTKFHSVVKTKEKAIEITFDRSLLPQSNVLPGVQFNRPDSRMAKIAGIALDTWRRGELSYYSWFDNSRSGGNPDAKAYDKSKDQVEYTKLIYEEKDTCVREYLLLKYFGFLQNEAKPEMAELFLREVSPSSMVWESEPDSYAFNWVCLALGVSQEVEEYEYRLINSQQKPTLVSSLLYYGLGRAFVKGNQMFTDLYYKRLVNEFPDSWYATDAVKKYSPENKFSKGSPIPFFTIHALGNEMLTYTSENMKSKVYLMDFWATWCPPCIEELPGLHQTYHAFKEKGFTILSISADEQHEKIDSFRKKRWEMPWMHSMLTNGLKDPFAVNFEVTDIPTQILVDEDGVILADPADIAKEGLQEILNGYFKSHKD